MARQGEASQKLHHGRRSGADRELYDFSGDVGETTDRAAAEPERVGKMLAMLDAWDSRLTKTRWEPGRRSAR